MRAYLGKTPDGRCDPFFFEQDIEPEEVELSDDMFIVTAERAKKCIEPPTLKHIELRADRECRARQEPDVHLQGPRPAWPGVPGRGGELVGDRW
jgi:hypothetical protein